MEIKKIDAKEIAWIVPNRSEKYQKVHEALNNAKYGEGIEITFPTKPCHKFYFATFLLQSFRRKRYGFDIRTKVLNAEGTKIAVMKLKRESPS